MFAVDRSQNQVWLDLFFFAKNRIRPLKTASGAY
jgi:hypothetical protein